MPEPLKLTIEYVSEGIAIGDAYAEKFVTDFVFDVVQRNKSLHVETSSGLVVYAARCLYAEGFFAKNNVGLEFEYNGRELLPNKDGALDLWPNGFCDRMDDFLKRLMKARFKDKEEGAA